MTDEPDLTSDPLAMFEMVEPMRETLRGLVAAFISDGFSDPQARDLVVSMWVQSARGATP